MSESSSSRSESSAACSSQPASESFSVRYDPIQGWPVFYAPPRALRPSDFQVKETLPDLQQRDPFVEGEEDDTTPEVFAFRDPESKPNGPGWQVRIIPNKFPAIKNLFAEIEKSNSCGANGSPLGWSGLCDVGVHEVIIECPQRETHFTRLSDAHRELIFLAIHGRLGELSNRPELAHALVFKNHGRGAGASLAHTHSQLMATPFLLPQIRRELVFFRGQAVQNRDYFAELLKHELACGERVIEEGEHFVLICPETSRFGLEMQLIPKSSQPHYHLCSRAELQELSRLMTRALNRLEKLLGDPDYNLVLHTAPFHEAELGGYRWHWEIYPRLAGIAGFELGGGAYVNAIYPEKAAHLLRTAFDADETQS